MNIMDNLWKLSPQKLYQIISGKNKKGTVLGKLKQLEEYPRRTEGMVKIAGMDILFNDSAAFIYQFNEIFIKENYKYLSTEENPIIYDCGANIGLSVLYYKKLFPKAVIKAFEPDPDIFKLLYRNIEKNSIMQATAFNKGIWDANTVLKFGRDGADGGSFYKTDNCIEAETIRLKELLDSERQISLLKLDIEGAELKVIKDCNESLRKADNIFIEYHSFSSKNQDLDVILRILKENGFRFTLQPISDQVTPFLSFEGKKTMDLQINIYAKRNIK